MKLYIIYGKYFPSYANCFGRPLRPKKSMYRMTNSGNIFFDELTNWSMDEAGFKHTKFQTSIYYKCATYASKLVVLSYVDDCEYWNTSEELGKWFVDTL